MARIDERGHIALPHLREWRARAGKTRLALAYEAGITESTLAKLELGKTAGARPGTVEKIARALHITVDQLVAAPPDGQEKAGNVTTAARRRTRAVTSNARAATESA